MQNALAEGTIGAAVMIDLEAAFDSAWRNGVIYKMHESGIKGRLLLACPSYLNDRISRNLVNEHVGDWIYTTFGFPQGALLSTFFFLITTHVLKVPKHPPPPSLTDSSCPETETLSVSAVKGTKCPNKVSPNSQTTYLAGESR